MNESINLRPAQITLVCPTIASELRIRIKCKTAATIFDSVVQRGRSMHSRRLDFTPKSVDRSLIPSNYSTLAVVKTNVL